MVGGIVRQVLITGGRVWINCEGTGCEENSFCAIYVVHTPESEQVKVGDGVWWQGRQAFWTPRHINEGRRGGPQEGRGTLWDIPLNRIGYSGTKSPAQVMIEAAYALPGKE